MDRFRGCNEDDRRPVCTGVPPIARVAANPDTLAPDGSEIRLLIGSEHAVARASLCEVRLPAGQASRPVWHRQVEEIWYVLEGHGAVTFVTPVFHSPVVYPVQP